MFGLPFTPFVTILLAIFLVSCLVQLYYNLFFYSRVAFGRSKPITAKATLEPVSVIICARNEAENLKNFLPSVLEQDYPDFEVNVINDCSEDETEEVLKLYSHKYPHLKVTTIYKDLSLIHSKKMALFIGIKSAKNDLLLLTDADCQPVSQDWIRFATQGFDLGKEFILGYGGYLNSEGLLNKYIRFDTMTIAMQYLGMAKAGSPYMGVGRNLAYRKSIFFKNRGFGSHLNLQSGDDDLFVNALATSKNTHSELDPKSFTRSVPSSSWSSFRLQKMRHMSTSGYYRRSTRFLLAAEPITRLLYFSSFAALVSLSTLPLVILPLFGITWFSRLIVLSKTQKALNERDLLLISPLFDIASIFINASLLFSSRINKRQNYEWK